MPIHILDFLRYQVVKCNATSFDLSYLKRLSEEVEQDGFLRSNFDLEETPLFRFQNNNISDIVLCINMHDICNHIYLLCNFLAALESAVHCIR